MIIYKVSKGHYEDEKVNEHYANHKKALERFKKISKGYFTSLKEKGIIIKHLTGDDGAWAKFEEIHVRE